MARPGRKQTSPWAQDRGGSVLSWSSHTTLSVPCSSPAVAYALHFTIGPWVTEPSAFRLKPQKHQQKQAFLFFLKLVLLLRHFLTATESSQSFYTLSQLTLTLSGNPHTCRWPLGKPRTLVNTLGSHVLVIQGKPHFILHFSLWTNDNFYTFPAIKGKKEQIPYHY